MSEMGQKRKFSPRALLSALPLKADIRVRSSQVRLVPITAVQADVTITLAQGQARC